MKLYLFVLMLLLAACGKTGDLYLPEPDSKAEQANDTQTIETPSTGTPEVETQGKAN